jgi:probable F420-dependent oxidoreductase
MAAERPFRFGVQVNRPPSDITFPELARKAEDLGYATLTVSDHLDDQYAITPALMAAADATTSLRIGSLTYCNDYRHPVVLAKEGATLDLLSDGRFEFGLGAGWMTSDYHESGIPLDPPGRRIARLGEALDVITGLWGDGPCTVDGSHYRISDLDGQPKPSQRPRPPILVGGGGRRLLTLAAQRADIVGVNVSLGAGQFDDQSGPSATHRATLEKIRWIRDAAGDGFDALELQVRIHFARVTDERHAAGEAIGSFFGLDPAEALASPQTLAGSVPHIVEQCLERRATYGFSYIGLSLDALEAMAPVVATLTGQ